MSREKRFAVVLVALLVLPALRLVAVRDKFASGRDVVDFLVFGWDEQTVYAPDFTEERFAMVKVGATESEVVASVGTPLRTAPGEHDDTLALYYSSARAPNGSFWLRFVVVDRNGRVVSVHRSFFSD